MNENETVVFNLVENAPNIPTSQHPVLTALNEKIATLEAEVQKWKGQTDREAQLRRESITAKRDYQERVKTVLVETLQSGDYDEETVKHIAEQLDIPLTVTKQIEVNVTFTVDLEYEVGEEPDPEWDFEFTVSHSDIIDYQSDVVWSKEV